MEMEMEHKAWLGAPQLNLKEEMKSATTGHWEV
jgi:hypothetical protein